ncbi:uncharacterized protein LOC125945348 [Dermacentor silvarum]|uniref:uncharacterized protein LOC125945348 n=1 Tax=Dermacentor silvarum TaxID=543639 RepID=UPI002101073E|nr:uncharacterized protein LOC125945348 [Dermacentor silvarum]
MALTAVVSVVFFTVGVLVPSFAQRYEQLNDYALGRALFLANNYGDRSGYYGNPGMGSTHRRYNDLSHHNFDTSRDGDLLHQHIAQGTQGHYFIMPPHSLRRGDIIAKYLHSVDVSNQEHIRPSPRRKRSPRGEWEREYDERKTARHGWRRTNRRRWERLHDDAAHGPAKAGTGLVRLHGCPKSQGPIRLTLKVANNE